MTRRVLPWVLLAAMAGLPESAGASTCSGDLVAEAQLDATIVTLERAWTSMDQDGVQAQATALQSQLACADRPISPILAARIHRSLGLALVTRGDQEGAARAFASARVASPDLALPSGIAPKGSVVSRLYERPYDGLPPRELGPPRQGSLVIDGRVSTQAPVDRPLVLQHLAEEGRVMGTWHLDGAADVPAAPWADPRRRARRATRYGGAAALGLGAIAFGVAGASHAAHQKDGVARTVDELVTYRDTSRVSSIAGAGLLVGGATAVSLSFSRALR